MDERLKALEMAMQLERDGQVFYRKAASRTNSPKGRAMFLSLADDEALHLRLLERQCNSLTENHCYAPLTEMGAAGPDWDAPIFPKDPGLFKKAVQPDASDADALLYAMQAENKSFELYRKLAQEASDPAGQALFRWLASVERGHFNQLMLNYESLVSSGAWTN
jgi:rubrerythrin